MGVVKAFISPPRSPAPGRRGCRRCARCRWTGAPWRGVMPAASSSRSGELGVGRRGGVDDQRFDVRDVGKQREQLQALAEAAGRRLPRP